MVKYFSRGGSLGKAVPPTDNKNKGSGVNSQKLMKAKKYPPSP